MCYFESQYKEELVLEKQHLGLTNNFFVYFIVIVCITWDKGYVLSFPSFCINSPLLLISVAERYVYALHNAMHIHKCTTPPNTTDVFLFASASLSRPSKSFAVLEKV